MLSYDPQALRKLGHAMWVRFLFLTGCLRWAKRRLRREGGVAVLMGHRVLNDADLASTNSLPQIIVRQATFDRLLKHIASRYEFSGLRGARPERGRIRFVLTFDDGWADNYSTALPIALARRVPVSIFICPGIVGCTTPFWPEKLAGLMAPVSKSEIADAIEELKQLRPDERDAILRKLAEDRAEQPACPADRTLNWREIVEMDRAGVCFGSHTLTHQILTAIPRAEVQDELNESRRQIEARLHHTCEWFAYPNGNWSPETRDLVASAGYDRAVTTELGVWTANCDPLAIPRINVSEENLTGLTGKWSRAQFEYHIFWKTRRARTAIAAPERNFAHAAKINASQEA